jgi:hypothetical protein
MRRLVIAIVLALPLAACDRGLSGTWQDTESDASYRFEPDGTASISVLGARVDAEYTVDGDKVLVSSPQGTVVLKMKEGRLYGPMGRELVRRPER